MTRIHKFSLLLFLTASVLVCGNGLGQTASDTGRHKPRPKPPAKAKNEERPNSLEGPYSPQWSFGFGAGLLGAGRAFRVETVNNLSVPWDLGSGGGFQASRFNATFDQNLSFGMDVSRDLSPVFLAGASLTYSRMNLGAEALAGQNGYTVLLDRVDVFQFGLGLTGKLVAAPSYPFLGVDAVWTNLSPGRLGDLDQSHVTWRINGGYRHILDDIWAAKIQARLSRGGFSIGDYQPQTLQVDPPQVEIDSENQLTIFEIMLSLEFH